MGIRESLGAVARDRAGGTLVYAAFTMMALLAAGGLALDIGRMSLLRTQMQNHADALAMGAAVYLDGSTGARQRATQVAQNAMAARSGIPSDDGNLTIESIRFYSVYFPTPVEALTDLEAAYVEVTLAPKNVHFLLAPLLGLYSSTATKERDMAALAVAGPDPFVCNAPPLMMCNLGELDSSLDFFDPVSGPDHIGKQVVLKEPQGGNATMAPGNFGLLALPDGSKGANDIEDALAAVEPQQCYSLDVTTATGSKTNKIKEGINARFDMPGNPHPYPAPNVVNYLRDTDVAADPQNTKLGNGEWDLDGYWTAKHGGLTPADLTEATRYQTYLYELGVEYLRDGAKTVYPVPADYSEFNEAYAEFDLVSPPGADVPVDAAHPDDPNYDGVPSEAVASNGYARRLVKVAILDCIEQDVRGTGTYPTEGRYVEMFLTEFVPDPPDAAIFGEVVRTLTTLNTPDFHANVRLVK